MRILTIGQISINPDELDIPQGATANDTTVSTLLSIVFALGAGVALLVIIVAGIQFILSRGDPGRATTARNAILYAAVGLILCMTAFSLVRYFVGRL